MATTKQAKKRIIQSEKARMHNTSMRSLYRTQLKNVRQFINEKQKDTAIAAHKLAVPVIDKMVNKGIMHKNKAARLKSRLATALSKM